jgi:putative Flp pilus-assembly TadE/G-like protein
MTVCDALGWFTRRTAPHRPTTMRKWSSAVTSKAAPPRLGAILQRLLRDQRGVAAVLVALAFTVLIGFVALSVETGLWYAIKRQDQSAADAAAISGAYEIAQCQGSQCPVYSDICALAKRDAATNGFTFQSYTCPATTPGCTNPSSGQMCANNPPVSGGSDGDTKAVEVILNRQQNTFFANLFLSNVTIGTRAVAKVNLPGYTCDLSLAKSGTGISVQGSATLNLTGCGMAANSSDAASISFGGGNNDVLNASWFQTVGNYSSNGSPVLNVPTRLTNSTPVTDPYSCNPPQIGCAGQILYPSQSATTPAIVTTTPLQSNPPCFVATGNATLQPGLYGKSSGSGKCSNNTGSSQAPMEFASGTTTTLCPGVYYIDGEDGSGRAFYVHGGTVNMSTAGSTSNGITCPSNSMNGVTIVAFSLSGTKGGGFNFQNGTVNLSAPTAPIPSGCTLGSTPCIPSGILFYQDPADADTSKAGNGLTGDSTVTAGTGTFLQGAMYTPATNVTFSGNAGSTCFLAISLTMAYNGNSTMSGDEANCQAIGVTGPTVMNIALTE